MNSVIARILLTPLALLATGAAPAGLPVPGAEVAPEAAPAPAAPPGPQVYKLTVRPRATTRPALRHRLLPDVADETPGNAAPLYLLSFIQSAAFPRWAREQQQPVGAEEAARYGIKGEDFYPGFDRLSLYLQAPLDKLPQQEVDRFLQDYQPAFQTLDLAARREDCRWALPLREQGFGVPLPHLNPTRDVSNLMSVRARLQTARRDYAGALATLQGTFALARDLNDQALLVQALVGIGVAGKALEGVMELVQQPDAPNLYWALAALPSPFVDLRASLQRERASVLFAFPQLRRVGGANLSAEEWRAISRHIAQVTGARAPGTSSELSAAVHGAIVYPRAKQWLIEHGTPAQEVEALSVASVLARHQLGEHEVWYDEVLKLTTLPYWQAHEGLRRVERRVADERDNPLVATIPPVQRAYFAGVKLDRQIAALQTVEALRNYAAAHDGELPARLEELSETPAAFDPSTGKPFAYRVQDNRVTLESPAPPGERPSDAMRVEVTFEK